MAIWRVEGGRHEKLPETNLRDENLMEENLEDWIAKDPELLGEPLFVIGRIPKQRTPPERQVHGLRHQNQHVQDRPNFRGTQLRRRQLLGSGQHRFILDHQRNGQQQLERSIHRHQQELARRTPIAPQRSHQDVRVQNRSHKENVTLSHAISQDKLGAFVPPSLPCGSGNRPGLVRR